MAEDFHSGRTAALASWFHHGHGSYDVLLPGGEVGSFHEVVDGAGGEGEAGRLV